VAEAAKVLVGRERVGVALGAKVEVPKEVGVAVGTIGVMVVSAVPVEEGEKGEEGDWSPCT
jgi:hypothetical protein